ncbi:hypothetical protein Clacol_005767 [Clathrus columnatus]|uniref:Myosin-binding domain-containing protein n=1 Tax=Clathrus columnatus TaxID=1419009 RepID=A0AAV5AFV2_9AGAM|nr:hypothetical protein Clacol_005767 [Clathrus columnatus]
MAQALFDDHPIEEYLRESGELPESFLPGGIYEFVKEPGSEDYGGPIENEYISEISTIVLDYLGLNKPSPSHEFAERFKYLIISSSLLSASLSSTQNSSLSPTAPGHYPPISVVANSPPISTTDAFSFLISSHHITLIILCLTPIFFALGYYVVALIAVFTVRFLATHHSSKGNSWSLACFKSISYQFINNHINLQTLEALETLVSSNETWENTVNESLKLLETEEQSPLVLSLYPLRQTLFETLRTIQTQCDDVRQLLVALSSPETISQLSPMYAPPSPSHLEPSFGFSIPNRRPLSLVGSFHISDSDNPSRTRSQRPLSDKRATWNAPSSHFSPLSSPSKRDSKLFTMSDYHMQLSGVNLPSSAPVSPSSYIDPNFPSPDGEQPFGVAALSFRRRKRPSLFNPSNRNTLTGLSGSRFTSLMSSSQANSDPRMAIQAVLAARRYTCSHLLALRFPDLDSDIHNSLLDQLDSSDEGYWEDVRSIISLLSSVYRDATARLDDVLEPYQSDKANETLVEPLEHTPIFSVPLRGLPTHPPASPEPLSFAPMLSRFSRFASHIDAISNALSDARSYLQQCVEGLNEDGVNPIHIEESCNQNCTPEFSPLSALNAYEELRRTLGYALRECERGREPLRILLEDGRKSIVDQIDENNSNLPTTGVEAETEQHDEQLSSGDSDKTLYNIDDPVSDPREGEMKVEDDATNHLLDSASVQHLPPPGIEQVFEAESTPISFTRSRSKSTREERIAFVRAQRKEGIRGSLGAPNRQSLGLGPGGEVVQELKDVIWKVSEQRRQMSLTHVAPITFSKLSLSPET